MLNEQKIRFEDWMNINSISIPDVYKIDRIVVL